MRIKGAVAEQIGSGLQNRVHRCDSGPRLQTSLFDFVKKLPPSPKYLVVFSCGGTSRLGKPDLSGKSEVCRDEALEGRRRAESKEKDRFSPMILRAIIRIYAEAGK